jgi:hypothetical protein
MVGRPATQLHPLACAGLTAGEAARLLGKNRQNAYALRKRPGAESFAAAWDAAVAHARRRRTPPAAAPPEPASKSDVAALARRGLEAVGRAAKESEAARRRAFSEMLDSFHGPKREGQAGRERLELVTIMNFASPTVALGPPTLWRPPC